MTSHPVVLTGNVLRQIVIGTLQGIPEDKFDVQPAGYNNTIRWNTGHIVYWMDKYTPLAFGLPTDFPPCCERLFASGTKPSDWTETPPSKEELIEQLTAQLSRLSEISPGMLEAKLASPYVMGPFRFETADELFNFALMHESIHLGVMTSQLKTI
jgi:hypothetical protein